MIAPHTPSAAALLVWLALSAAPVHAQACEDGRVSIDGVCCWEGQRVVAGICVGAPTCGAGSAATLSGTCVVLEGERAEVPPPDDPPAFVRDRHDGLVAAGAALFFGGHLAGVLTAYFLSSLLFPVAFVPFLHSIPLLSAGLPPEEGYPLSYGITAIEAVGLTLWIIGESGRRVPVVVAPSASSERAGLLLRLAF